MIKTIFWDYDGVIMDSMPIRTNGFRILFSSYTEKQINALIEFHLTNGGLSRYVKIRYFYETILNKPISESEVNTIAEEYSKIVLNELLNDKLLITDSLKFIKANHTKYNFHIVSGSDGNELNYICKSLKIDKYFKSINGSPTPKAKLVKEILTHENYYHIECCLIGDSKNDFDAATDNNIIFYGYNSLELKGIGKNYISSFDEFRF